MKTVVNREMVAHLFANQSQDNARTASNNFYFVGNRCNSYGSHFRAAVHHGDCVLLNRETYSNTTARQMSALRMACRHLRTFEVANPDADTKADHRENYREMVREYETEVLRVSRARVYNQLGAAESMLADTNAYAAWSKIGNRLKPIALENAKAAAAARTVKNIAARKRAQRAREKADKIAAERRAQSDTINAAGWRAGKYHYPLFNIPVMLRLTSDGETVQTSHGASFPTEHARKSIALVLRIMRADKTWQSNGQNIRLGHFQIDVIRGNVLLAGCHKVSRDEIERLNTLLGVRL